MRCAFIAADVDADSSNVLFTSIVVSAELSVVAVAADVRGAACDVVFDITDAADNVDAVVADVVDVVAAVCSGASVGVCAWVLDCGDSVKGNDRLVSMGRSWVSWVTEASILARQARVTWLRRVRVL